VRIVDVSHNILPRPDLPDDAEDDTDDAKEDDASGAHE